MICRFISISSIDVFQQGINVCDQAKDIIILLKYNTFCFERHYTKV